MKKQSTALPETQPAATQDNGVTWGPLAAIAVTLGAYFGAQFGAILLVMLYPLARGWSMERINAWLQASSVVQFVAYLLIAAISMLLLRSFLRYRKTGFKAIGWNRKPQAEDAAWAFAIFALYFILLTFIIFPLTKILFPSLNFKQSQEIGFAQAHGPVLVLVFISLAVLPPLIEETLMRGFLYSGLRKKLPVYAAAILTSVIFAVAHLQLGSGQPALWTAAIDTFTLSLFLVFLRQKTGSLYASMGVHFIKNSLAFLALFILHVK